MAIFRRRFALAGAAIVLLAAVGAGLVQASSAGTDVPQSAAGTEAPSAATPGGRPSTTDTAVLADPAARLGERLGMRGRGRIVHGTVTIDSPKDGLITVQIDGGTIAAVDGASLTIAEKGGGTVTVAIDAGTRVRRSRTRASVVDLKVGDTVRVVSRVAAGGGATAKAIVVPPAG